MGSRSFNDPYGDAARVSDKMLGTVYDDIRFVGSNIEYIKHVSYHLENLFRISQNVDAIEQVENHIPDLLNIYNNMDELLGYAVRAETAAENAETTIINGIENITQISNDLTTEVETTLGKTNETYTSRAAMVAAAPFTEGKWLYVLKDENFKNKETVYQYVSGAFSLKKVDKNIPSFYDFGLVDDDPGNNVTNGTDNDAAWEALLAATSNGDRIRVPKLNTGVFYFATQTMLTMADRLLDTQGEKISFRGPSVMGYAAGSTGPKYAQGTITLWNTALQMKFDIMSDPRKQPKQSFLRDGQVDYSRVTPLDMTSLSMERVAWPTGDTWTSVSGEGIGANSQAVIFGQSTMLGSYMYGALTTPKYGRQYTWNNRRDPVDSNGIWNIIIRTENYYNLFYSNQDSGIIQFASKSPGVDAVQASLPNLESQATQADLFLCNAMVTVDVIDAYTYQLGINGVCVYTGILPEPIIAVGPGAYRTGTSLIISEMLHEVSQPVPLAPRPKRILILGDSLTDKINAGWPDDLGEILQDSMGCQIEFVRNIAVAGDGIQHQLDDLMALGPLTGYTDVITSIGTNNGQAQTNYSVFENYLTSLLDYVQSYNLNHILVSPANFYSRALAQANGGFGQDTGNGEKVSAYRTRIAHAVGNRQGIGQRIGHIDANRVIGSIQAKYINSFIAGSSGAETDPGVMDNIHWTRRARRKIAHAVAAKLLGVERRQRNPGLQAVIPSSWFQNGYTNGVDGSSSTYGITPDGKKWLSLFIKPGSSTADGTVVLTVPRHMRPHAAQGNLYRPGFYNSNSACRFDLNWDGTVQIAGASGGFQMGTYIEYF